MTGNKSRVINPWISVGVLVFSAIVATFNETILNVALLSISDDMNVSIGIVQWLITGYMLVASIMVPVTAFLYHSVPTKKLYLTAMGVILLGSLGCYFALNFPMLLIFRLFQSVGTGMMIPILMNSVLLIAPKNEIGKAMALCVCGISVGPALGPTISGIIVQFFSWRESFLLVLILVIAAIIMGIFTLSDVAELTHPLFDIPSVILSSIGLAFFLYGISILSSQTVIGIVCIAIGAIVMSVFVLRQNELEEPMLNLKPFRNINFTLGVGMVTLTFLLSFSLNVIMPSYLQGALLVSQMASALLILPGVVLNAASTNISGKILDKHGANMMLFIGFIVGAAGLVLLSTSGMSSRLFIVMIMHIIAYQGFAYTMSPGQTSALKVLPKELNAHGVAILNTFMQIGAGIGSSLFGGIQSSVQTKSIAEGVSQRQSVANGFTSTMNVAVVIALMGFVLAILYVKNQKSKAVSPKEESVTA